ncbi:MAG: hypothetical protein SGJ19_12055 [Planctomycetia bacterium]|nr:hypothetical protein [Planctomycetia bacterium]
MTVTHVGSNEQYASNWESIFTKRAKKQGAATKTPAKTKAKGNAKKQTGTKSRKK